MLRLVLVVAVCSLSEDEGLALAILANIACKNRSVTASE